MKPWMKFGLIGALAGMAIGQIIVVIISWFAGSYLPCTPAMIETYGTLLAATIQTVVNGLLGFVFGAVNQVWTNPWSLTRQTLTVYFCYMFSYLAAAWINCWIDHTLAGVLQIVVIFTAIFVLIWLKIWFHIKKTWLRSTGISGRWRKTILFSRISWQDKARLGEISRGVQNEQLKKFKRQ